jgi:hypothetical protein
MKNGRKFVQIYYGLNKYKPQQLIKFMLTFEVVLNDKHSTKICAGGKISDFSVAQIL